MTGRALSGLRRTRELLRRLTRNYPINEQMRTIASQLTATEMHAVVELYGVATPTRMADR
jgi:hypothetical protein